MTSIKNFKLYLYAIYTILNYKMKLSIIVIMFKKTEINLISYFWYWNENAFKQLITL